MNEFARALGFQTYSDLMMASKTMHQEGDISWYSTACPDGRWAVWDDAELSPDRVRFFGTREEAEEDDASAWAEANERENRD